MVFLIPKYNIGIQYTFGLFFFEICFGVSASIIFSVTIIARNNSLFRMWGLRAGSRCAGTCLTTVPGPRSCSTSVTARGATSSGGQTFSLLMWLFYLGAVFQIRIQLNPDPAKNLNPDPDPGDLESGSGSKLFLNTVCKKIKITS